MTHVMIDGRMIVEERKGKTVDEAEALRECQKRAEGVWRIIRDAD